MWTPAITLRTYSVPSGKLRTVLVRSEDEAMRAVSLG